MKSRVAAFAVPAVGVLAGASSTAVAWQAPRWQSWAEGVSVAAVVLAGLVWLFLDARERDHRLTLALVLGAIVVPVLALPYYFNQTRERQARAGANARLLLTAVGTIAGYWLGSAMASGRP